MEPVTGKSLSLPNTCSVSLVSLVFLLSLEWKLIMSTCLIDAESAYPNFIWTNLKERHCLYIYMAMGIGVNMSNIKQSEFLEDRQKVRRHFKTCTKIFITVSFIITKKWKQPKCSSRGLWHIHSNTNIHCMNYLLVYTLIHALYEWYIYTTWYVMV